jgi:CTP synthase
MGRRPAGPRADIDGYWKGDEMARFIFVTGGVVSSLGKGIAAATMGYLLKQRGVSVTLQKCDPYLNVDPGTMSPFQHGEVYVTDDGAETDLDLGHYERFADVTLTRENNTTAGHIYDTILSRERRGDFLGKTVQVIPHVTDEIKRRMRMLADAEGVDCAIVEIGGTVGDIESLPFLEAIRQLRLELGPENTVFVHVTLVPYIKASREMKTKPTQHSVKELREIGIQPDVLICRTEQPMHRDLREKIALFCNVDVNAVIEARDVSSIYEVPLVFHRGGLDDLLIGKLRLPAGEADLSAWEDMVECITSSPERLTIAICGKYVHLHDAYKSIIEACTHGGVASRARVDLRWVDSEEVNERNPEDIFAGVDGILVPGGFGQRGTDGMVRAVRYARESGIPFFGICLGFQCMMIDFARNVCGFTDANSSEFDGATPHPVIDLMSDQAELEELGGTMRLGAQDCDLRTGSRAFEAYGTPRVSERHRHRYEFNNDYRERFEGRGMIFSGTNPDRDLVEIGELPDHPWFVGVQFHPELKSRPRVPHPLFSAFVRAALHHSKKEAIRAGG